MNGTFPGLIVLDEGDEVEVDLHLADEKVRLATPFAEIGLWDRDSILFEGNAAGGFELKVADDVVTFYPTDSSSFAAAIARNGYGSDPIVPRDVENEPDVGYAMNTADSSAPGFSDEAFTEFPASSSEATSDASLGVSEGSDEPSVTNFGRSSRERLAAAMSDFRDRHEDLDREASSVVESDFTEEPSDNPIVDDPPAPPPSASGFLIPGDEGYVFPDDAVLDESPAEVEDGEAAEEVTVADEILASQRSLRGATKMSSINPYKLKRIAAGLGILAVLVGIGFSVPIVIDFFSSPADAQDTVTPTTVAVTASTAVVQTTVATEPVPPPAESAFDLSSPAFVERWNELAAQVSPSLRFRSSLPAGDFEVGFTPFIAMLGVSDSASAESTIEAFTIEVDPTGPSASDRLGIQALGLAIAVADPSLEPNQRGALLGEMGLNVRDPSLAGLNGSTVRNGVGYQLFYDAEAVMLRMEVVPQS